MASGVFARTVGSLGVPERHLTGRRGTMIALAVALVLTLAVGALIGRATEYATLARLHEAGGPALVRPLRPGPGAGLLPRLRRLNADIPEAPREGALLNRVFGRLLGTLQVPLLSSIP